MDAETYNKLGAQLEAGLNENNTDYTWRVCGAHERIFEHAKYFPDESEDKALEQVLIRAATKQRYENGRLFIFCYFTTGLIESAEQDLLYSIIKRTIDNTLEDELAQA